MLEINGVAREPAAETQLVFIVRLAALVAYQTVLQAIADVGKPAEEIKVIGAPIFIVHAEKFVDQRLSIVNQQIGRQQLNAGIIQDAERALRHTRENALEIARRQFFKLPFTAISRVMIESHYFRQDIVDIGSIFNSQKIQRAQLAAHVFARAGREPA